MKYYFEKKKTLRKAEFLRIGLKRGIRLQGSTDFVLHNERVDMDMHVNKRRHIQINLPSNIHFLVLIKL